MAKATYKLFRLGKCIGDFEVPGWNGVHPPKFGPVGDTRDRWCKPVDIPVVTQDGDIVVCTFPIVNVQGMWVSEEQHQNNLSDDIQNYWYRSSGLFHEITKDDVVRSAKLTRRGPKPKDGCFHVGDNKFYTRREAAEWCSRYGETEIVYPCGGVEDYVASTAGSRRVVERLKNIRKGYTK